MRKKIEYPKKITGTPGQKLRKVEFFYENANLLEILTSNIELIPFELSFDPPSWIIFR